MGTVGVIILNYNNFLDTSECIDSLLKVEYNTYKIYLVDNLSTDDSFGKLQKKYSPVDNIELIQSGKNGGFSFGNNVGIKKALSESCEYLLILNNDTTVHPSFLKNLVNCAEKDPNIGVVTGKAYYYGHPNKLHMCGGTLNFIKVAYSRFGAGQEDRGQYDFDRYVTFSSLYFSLVRSSVFEDLGLFNEGYFGGTEETDFNYKISRSKWTIFYTHKAMIWHKIGGTFKSGRLRSTYMAIRNKFLFVKENYTLTQKIIWVSLYSLYLLSIHVPKRFLIEAFRGNVMNIFKLYHASLSA